MMKLSLLDDKLEAAAYHWQPQIGSLQTSKHPTSCSLTLISLLASSSFTRRAVYTLHIRSSPGSASLRLMEAGAISWIFSFWRGFQIRGYIAPISWWRKHQTTFRKFDGGIKGAVEEKVTRVEQLCATSILWLLYLKAMRSCWISCSCCRHPQWVWS